MRLHVGALPAFYLWRLRRYWAQELLAVAGVAAGVALVFAVLVANSSLTGPTRQLLSGLGGAARLELAARSAGGFDERLLARVRGLPDVRAAVPLLRESAAVLGPRGRRSVELLGVTPGLDRLGGLRAVDAQTRQALAARRLGLPPALAHALGIAPGRRATLLAGGVAYRGPTFALSGRTARLLTSSDVVVTLLPLAQLFAGEQRRVTQALIVPRAGTAARLAAELRNLVGGRVAVDPVGSEIGRLDATTAPNDRATLLFAAVGALVGFLLTLNTVLLTAPERRRSLADLRTQGFETRQIVALLGFQVVALGSLASLIGVALGDLLAHTLLRESPAYLAFAFPIGVRETVPPGAVLAAVGCGLGATLLASLPLLADLGVRRRACLRAGGPGAGRPRAGDPRAGGERYERASADGIAGGSPPIRRAPATRAARPLAAVGVALTALPALLLVLAPRASAIGDGTLALAALLLIPALFAVTLRVLARVAERLRGSMLAIALAELRATPLHAIGLAGVAAVAVYGSVAIRGAQHDLTRGLDRATSEFFATADIWVTSGSNEFVTSSFRDAGARAALARAPGVAAVHVYQGGLLNVGERRMWLRARPADDRSLFERGQLVEGRSAQARRRIARGGWIAISSGLADERGLRVGGNLTLPTPSGPVRFGIAAVTTNLGWLPGALTLNSSDYRRYWRTSAPTALEVLLRPGVAPARGLRAVRRALSGRPGLQARSAPALDATFERNVDAGLHSLGEISTLLLVAAALALAAALGASIWSRRPRLAALKIQGFRQSQLWRAIMLESAIVLAVGSSLGLLLGIFGHILANGWLEFSTGFPAPFGLDGGQLLLTLLLVAAVALTVIALPGLGATRVSPQLGFEE
jgi:putative ABC transport system permease protein